MAFEPKQLDEATADERRAFATGFLNLDLDADASDDAVLSAIKQAQPKSEIIFVSSQPAPAVDAPAAAEPVSTDSGRQQGSLGKGDPQAIIIIPELENSEGKNTDVFVGVNGRAWQLKRGAELKVPWRVVEALQLAMADVVTHSQDPESVGDVNIRNAKRFPFEFQSRPTDSEIAEWRERTGAEFCA